MGPGPSDEVVIPEPSDEAHEDIEGSEVGDEQIETVGREAVGIR